MAGMLVLTGCSDGPNILEVYEMSATEAADRVPKLVHVCWALEAGHMSGAREAGLEQDIADTCERSSREVSLSDECRAYARIAARYGRAAVGGKGLAELVSESDEAFASCAS
ncbi:MAG TPA: hypothetical protein VFT61_02740 [Sphingomicrobium sp.]|nr:hypothetical protein [Sphingomicrobium sp.]